MFIVHACAVYRYTVCTTEIWLLFFFIYVVKSIAFKALQWSHTHWCGCIPFSIILLSTFAKQINDAVGRNLRRVSHVNLLFNFKNRQYSGCCQLKYFPLLYMSKCRSSIIAYLQYFNYCILANHITPRSTKRQKISRKLSA